jgi:riboflavin kinase/FMN adenylyltransferase
MKVISLNGSSKLQLKKTCAAIGIFDGVHRGHQYLIKQMLTTARRLKAKPIVITFFPHPAHVLKPELKLGYLTSLDDRFRLLNDLGVDLCVVVRFDKAFAGIEPQKFIQEILVKKLGVKAIFVGEKFRFGKDRAGDINLFQKLAVANSYEMHAVPSLKQGEKVISSTRIRQSVLAGKLSEAAKLLGRPVFTSGIVVKGSQRGKALGYATANLACESDVLPPQGVYAVRVRLGTKLYPAIANLGLRPTFDKQFPELCLEVHLFDFSRNIYGQHMQVEFLKKIRNEKKFPNAQKLIQQIQKDEIAARQFLALNLPLSKKFSTMIFS